MKIFDALFESISDMAFILDSEGNIKAANSKAIDTLGYTISELTALSFPQIHIDDIEKEMELCFKSMLNGDTKVCRFPLATKDSIAVPVETSVKKITDDGIDKYLVLAKNLLDVLTNIFDLEDCQRTKEEVEKSNLVNIHLAIFTKELAELGEDDDIIDFILHHLKRITNAQAVTYSSYNPAKKALVLEKIDTKKSLINTIVNIAGNSILKTESPVSDEMYEEIIRHNADKFKSFTEVSFGAIPSAIDVAIRKVTGIEILYTIAYTINKKLYGTSLIALTKNQAEISIDLLKTFATISSISINKRYFQKSLKESMNKYRTLFESSALGIAFRSFVDSNSEFNNAYCNMLGYSYEELKILSQKDLTHPDDYHITASNMNKIANGELDKVTYQKRYINKNREIIWGEIAVQGIKSDDGKVVAAIGTVQDISDKKKIEFEFKRTISLLDKTGNIAKIGGWELDLNTMQVFWTKETYNIYGIDDYSIEPNLVDAISYYTEQSQFVLRDALKNATDNGIPYDLQLEMNTNSGKRIYIRTIGHPTFSGGKIVKLSGTIQDISEQIEAEAKLRLSEENYRQLVEKINDGILKINSNNEISFVNNRLCDILGYSEVELLGNNCENVFRIISVDGQKLINNFDMSSQLGKYLICVLDKEDNPIWLSINASPIFDTNTNIIANVSIVRDITFERNSLIEIAKTKEKYLRFFEEDISGNYLSTPQGKLLDCNTAFVNMLGYSSKEEIFD